MLVRECMSKNVVLGAPEMPVSEAAQKMRNGDFGILPVAQEDRLVGMVTDRDIAIRAVAEGKNPDTTEVSGIMSKAVLYCYDDQQISDVARNMAENQVRRLPVLNRQKRLVGIISLGDMSASQVDAMSVEDALCKISRHEHHEPSYTHS